MPDADTFDSYRTQETEQTPRDLSPDVPYLACNRKSPRPCINQALVDEMAILRKWRFLQFGTQSEKSIAYATATSVIIGSPFKIETVEQARKLPKVGEKIIVKIQEFLQKGYTEEARDVLRYQKYKDLELFQTINGIGWREANKHYDNGVRSLPELAVAKPSIEGMLEYLDDLNEKIPRSDVESICEFVKIQLDRVKRGAHVELCGGYRRGKEFSNDVDILVTFPHRGGEEKGVLKTLVKRMMAKGLVPEDGVLNASQAGTFRTIIANKPATAIDALDKALLIFRHPANITTRPVDKFRRIDIVVSNWETWGCALLAWTGSTQFERDLSRHCKKRNLNFDAGGFYTKDTGAVVKPEGFLLSHERDVFDVLELPWLDPELRNADP